MHYRPSTTNRGPAASERRGTVLLVVLVVVVMLALAAYQFSDRMTSEYKSSRSSLRAAQARALAESGIAYTAALLSNPDAFSSTLNSNPFNNPSSFQDQGSPQSGPGRFSIVAAIDPNDPNAGSQPYRFGVIDESGKINLNALLQLDKKGTIAKQILMALPNMTDDISDSILDWMDPDDDARPSGAESNYYSSLNPPYKAKNGPFESLEELLLVKGVTPQLLFGNDRNRNGVIDPDENDGSDPTNQLGWSAYLTVYSREQDLDSQNNPRIYLNDPDVQALGDKLSTALGDDLANFIMAARQYGLTTSSSSGSGSPKDADSSKGGASKSSKSLTRGMLGSSKGRPQKINSLYDLIGGKVSIPASGGGQATTYTSPLQGQDTLKQLLPLLLDKTTTTKPGTQIPPRININTAPPAVIQALSAINQNVTDADIQAILAQRPSPSATDPTDPIYQTPAWLIVQANLAPAKVKALEKYITGRTQVYRVQSVGYFPGGGPTARIEAVIDTNGGKPRIIYWRDLTELGKGFNLGNASK